MTDTTRLRCKRSTINQCATICPECKAVEEAAFIQQFMDPPAVRRITKISGWDDGATVTTEGTPKDSSK